MICGPIALFIDCMSSTKSGKVREYFENAHIGCFRYKLLSSASGHQDLFFGFARKINNRQEDFFDNKTTNGKLHVIIFVKDVSGFV